MAEFNDQNFILSTEELLRQNEEIKEQLSRLRAEKEKLEEIIGRQNELIKELHIELDEQHDDELTDALKPRIFSEMVEYRLAAMETPADKKGKRKEDATPESFSLLFCDLDNFKQINDIYGHAAGDKILRRVVEIIKSNLRASDLICRKGGDEFIIALQGANENEAIGVSEKLNQSIEKELQKSFQAEYPEINVSASIGIAEIKQGFKKGDKTLGNFLKEQIEHADTAMYAAKNDGKNRTVAFSRIKPE